jgi:carboxypeptidase Taq
MTSAYRDLERHFRRLGLLGEAAGMLQWDMAAVMPSGGAAIRGEQLAELRLVTHEMLTDARISDLLDRAEQDEVARLDARDAAGLATCQRPAGRSRRGPVP